LKLGRNFTNTLIFEHLTDEEKEKFLNNELSVEDVGVLCSERNKGDIAAQAEFAKEIKFDHIELDGDVPNPFLDWTEDEIIEMKDVLRKHNITASLHLPYNFVGASVCSIQKIDRELAVQLHKKYLDFAEKLGCVAANLHPGSIPFYHKSSLYVSRYRDALIESLLELSEYASRKKIKLHLENETAFHNFVYTPKSLLDVVETVRNQGGELYLNFDIGHWFTVQNIGDTIPDNPEKVIELFPSEYLYELHLNDYVAEEKLFHPPLNRYSGLMKRENLERYFVIVKKKGVKLIVIETAVRDREELIRAKDIIREESAMIRELVKNHKGGK